MRALQVLPAVGCLWLVPAIAQAQVTTFDDLAKALRPGETIVIRAPAISVTGKIDVSSTDIHFTSDGQDMRLGPDQVLGVGVLRHRVTFVGPLVGGLIGLGAMSFYISAVRDCRGCEVNGATEGRTLGTAIGALIGAGIQAARAREKWIYTAKPTVVAPVISRGGVGVDLTVKF